MLKNLQINMTFWPGIRIFSVTAQNQFQDNNFPKSYFLPIRGYSWHKNEIKMIRRGYYSINNLKEPTKEK